MTPLKKGDYICYRKSLKLIYKLYYIVTRVEESRVEAVRCSTTIPNTFVHILELKDVAKIQKQSVWMADYIAQQIEKWKETIENEDSFEVYLKKTNETIHLLTDDVHAITFYTRGEKRHFWTFELKENPQPVLLPNPYKDEAFRTKYEWIRVTLGRLFNVE